MYYNLFEDNENVEKHQKPVPCTTWEYYMEIGIKGEKNTTVPETYQIHFKAR